MKNKEEPLFIVGDVHGEYERLLESLEYGASLGRKVVLVGDYINRGMRSREVLELLCAYKDLLGEKMVLLRGNHEIGLERFLDGGPISSFAALGGLATIKSYTTEVNDNVVEEFRRNFPPKHRDLISNTQQFIETPNLLVSHTGLNPRNVIGREVEDISLNGSHELFTDSWHDTGPKLVICGHYVQESLRPYVSSRLICIDTGCGSIAGAPLTAVLYPELHFKQF